MVVLQLVPFVTDAAPVQISICSYVEMQISVCLGLGLPYVRVSAFPGHPFQKRFQHVTFDIYIIVLLFLGKRKSYKIQSEMYHAL